MQMGMESRIAKILVLILQGKLNLKDVLIRMVMALQIMWMLVQKKEEPKKEEPKADVKEETK